MHIGVVWEEEKVTIYKNGGEEKEEIEITEPLSDCSTGETYFIGENSDLINIFPTFISRFTVWDSAEKENFVHGMYDLQRPYYGKHFFCICVIFFIL